MLLLAIYTAVLLVGLMAPFEGYTRNDVRWAADGTGLQFVSSGIARSVSKPHKLHNRLVAAGQFSIEVWASPADAGQIGPARIVSYSADTRWRNFTVGQQGHALVVRLRTTRTNLNGSVPQTIVQDVFGVPGFRHIVVTYDGMHERVYIDGVVRATTADVHGSLRNWDDDHWLLIGNEHTASRPWRGAIRLLAIYDRVLAAGEVAVHHEARATHGAVGAVALYRFRESGRRVADESSVLPRVELDIPDVLEPVRPLLGLGFPTPKDLVLNLVLFVPVGFLAAHALRQRRVTARAAVMMSLALAAGLSLTAEVMQTLILSRSSELSDLVLNTAGAGIGASVIALRKRAS